MNLQALWTSVINSFWFVPAVLVIVSVLMAFGLVWVDRAYYETIKESLPFIFTGTPDSARGILSTIATTFATIVTVLFSITVVALQQAATQYSSRVLKAFTERRGYQIVLGSYVATYTYSLLVLRSVQSETTAFTEFVPQIAVTVALLVVVINVGLLVYFLNQITKSLQVTKIVDIIHAGILQNINKLYPSEIGLHYEEPEPVSIVIRKLKRKEQPLLVTSEKTGFVRNINEESLAKLNTKEARWIYIVIKPGDFISYGQTLAKIYPRRRDLKNLVNGIREALSVDYQRSAEQDAMYGLRQLVDVALKTASTNDQTTIEYSLKYLGDSLIRLSQRKFPSVKKTFPHTKTVFVFKRTTWEEYVSLAFEQIQPIALSHQHVLSVYLQTFLLLAKQIPVKERIAPLKKQLDLLKKELSKKEVKEATSRLINKLEKVVMKKCGCE